MAGVVNVAKDLGVKRVLVSDTPPKIRKREEFWTGLRKTPYGDFVSMSGLKGLAISLYGDLPTRYYDSLDDAAYVVRSYDTPIAWWIPVPADPTDLTSVEQWLAEDDTVGHWVMPAVTYSATTTQHQSEVRGALGREGYARTEYQLRAFGVEPGGMERLYSGCERYGW